MGYIHDTMIWMNSNMCEFCFNKENGRNVECDECGKSLNKFIPGKKINQFMKHHGYEINMHSTDKPILIIDFPGVGCSYFNKRIEGSTIRCVDIGNASYAVNSAYPQNLVNRLIEASKCNDFICVTFDKEIYEGIWNSDELMNTCNIYICYPEFRLKNMWTDRIRNKGNTKEYCKFIDDNYEEWINWIKTQHKFYPIVIESNTDYFTKHLHEIKMNETIYKNILRLL